MARQANGLLLTSVRFTRQQARDAYHEFAVHSGNIRELVSLVHAPKTNISGVSIDITAEEILVSAKLAYTVGRKPKRLFKRGD